MIQPLFTNNAEWCIEIHELDEPMLLNGQITLPALLIIHNEGRVLDQEAFEELDQRLVEDLIGDLFEEQGVPARMVIDEHASWNRQELRQLGERWRVEIAFSAREQRPGAFRRRDLLRLFQGHLASPDETGAGEIALALADASARVNASWKQERLLNKAVELDFGCRAAWVALGKKALQERQLEAALEYNQRAISAREKPAAQTAEQWWEDRDARAFLHALHGLALTQWELNELDEAIETARYSLQWNAADHLGMRFLLPLLHLLNEDEEGAAAFFQKYEGEYPDDLTEPAFHFLWGYVLSAEDEDAAIQKYRRGISRNIYIAPLLLDLRSPPNQLWHATEQNQPFYAYDFVHSAGGLWHNDAARLRTLREAWSLSEKTIDKLVEIWTRMFDLQNQRYDPRHEEKWEALLKEEKDMIRGF